MVFRKNQPRGTAEPAGGEREGHRPRQTAIAREAGGSARRPHGGSRL